MSCFLEMPPAGRTAIRDGVKSSVINNNSRFSPTHDKREKKQFPNVKTLKFPASL